jgi:hypothetical protein
MPNLSQLTGPVQMSKPSRDSVRPEIASRSVLQLASPSPRSSVLPTSINLVGRVDPDEVVRNFLYQVALGNERDAKGYYNGTIDGSSIRTIIDDFFNTKRITLKDADQAYSLIKRVIDRDLALKDYFKEKQRIIPDNFFKLLLKENQQGAGR